jgi:hypothetical protein
MNLQLTDPHVSEPSSQSIPYKANRHQASGEQTMLSKTPTFSLFSNQLISVEDLPLGTLITNLRSPLEYFHSVSIDPEDIIDTSSTHVKELLNHAKTSQTHFNLTKLLKGNIIQEQGVLVDIQSPEGKYYKLKQSTNNFHRICKDERTRKWFEEAISYGDDVYMIVAISTVSNAKISRRVQVNEKYDNAIQIPVTAIAAHGMSMGLDGGFGDILDMGVGVGGGKEKGEMVVHEFYAPGERIVAFECRKVKFRLFFSRSVENAFLEKDNRWKSLLAVRSDGDYEEDVVEAELNEESEEDFGNDVTFRMDDGVEYIFLQ